jgi:DNA-binding NarL/FixJ family response regulator
MKIMIVDQHVLFREGLISLLRDQSDINIVGNEGLGSDMAAQALVSEPSIILMDANYFEGEGREMMGRVLSKFPHTAFVILAPNENADLLLDAIRNGAKGYLPKNTSKSMLLASLRAIERGETAIPRGLMTNVIEEFRRMSRVTERKKIDIDTLTFRELQVLRLLATEATNSEIARQLVISDNTVRVHVHSILEKLHARNRRDAADFARRMRLYGSTQ